MSNEETKKKKEILKDIFLKEEDVLAKFERLVKLASPFLKVEEKSGRVVLSNDFELTNSEKLFLILLGKYFACHYEVIKDQSQSLNDLSLEIGGIPVTTLSAPISRLVKEKIVNKPEKGSYVVNPFMIENFLKGINNKYLEK